MKQKLRNRNFVAALTLALSVAGLLLRLLQRHGALGGSLLPLLILSAAVLVLAALTASAAHRRAGFSSNQRPSFMLLVVLLGALFMMLGGILRAQTLQGVQKYAALAGGTLGGLLLFAAVVQTLRNRCPSMLLYAALTLMLAFQLIFDFRAWSVDPKIADYCFRLFAAICLMGLSFQLCGFTAGMGRRREAILFCLPGTFFCLLCVADGTAGLVLSYLGGGLYLLGELWTLLAPPRRRSVPQETEIQDIHE